MNTFRAMRVTRLMLQCSIVWLLLGAIAADTSASGEFKVVIPPNLETVEGDSSICQTSASCVGISYRQQVVFPAAEFGALPQADLVITGMYYRPDHTAGPRSGTMADYLLRLSTTDRGPGRLSSLFANNIGADEVTVFDGARSVATQAIGPPEGPKDFDYYIRFQTPFAYDPSSGRNLLMDAKTLSGGSFVTLTDAFTSAPGRQIFSYNEPNAVSGSYFNPVPIVQFVFATEPVISPTGDFNGDNLVDVADIELLSQEVRNQTHQSPFDLNDDQLVNQDDRQVWVKGLKKTWFGDADLNGEFTSSDFVKVFLVGKFEQDVAADWGEGDWNGDGRFGSQDFVTAFLDGGFEQGPLPVAAVVPEPASAVLLILGGVLVLGTCRRGRCSFCR